MMGHFFMVIIVVFDFNVLPLGEEADFEALNCLPARVKFDTKHKTSFKH